MDFSKGYWTYDGSKYKEPKGNCCVRDSFTESLTDESFYTLSVESARQVNGLQIRDSGAFDFVNGEVFPDGKIVVPAGRKPFSDIVDAQDAVKSANARLQDSLYDDNQRFAKRAKESAIAQKQASEVAKADLVNAVKDSLSNQNGFTDK